MRELPRSVEQLTGLVGRVSLKDLVREATDVIERLCIEAALEVTDDTRAAALGLMFPGPIVRPAVRRPRDAPRGSVAALVLSELHA